REFPQTLRRRGRQAARARWIRDGRGVPVAGFADLGVVDAWASRVVFGLSPARLGRRTSRKESYARGEWTVCLRPQSSVHRNARGRGWIRDRFPTLGAGRALRRGVPADLSPRGRARRTASAVAVSAV